MNKPASIKALRTIKDVDTALARRIRHAWTCNLRDGETLEKLLNENPHTRQWYQSCYNTPGNKSIRRTVIDDMLGTFDVERLGVHKSSGYTIHYCNAGDTYATTILFIGNRMIVGDWGYYVERGLIRE